MLKLVRMYVYQLLNMVANQDIQRLTRLWIWFYLRMSNPGGASWTCSMTALNLRKATSIMLSNLTTLLLSSISTSFAHMSATPPSDKVSSSKQDWAPLLPALAQILLSNKEDDVASTDAVELLGFEELDLVARIIKHRRVVGQQVCPSAIFLSTWYWAIDTILLS